MQLQFICGNHVLQLLLPKQKPTIHKRYQATVSIRSIIFKLHGQFNIYPHLISREIFSISMQLRAILFCVLSQLQWSQTCFPVGNASLGIRIAAICPRSLVYLASVADTCPSNPVFWVGVIALMIDGLNLYSPPCSSPLFQPSPLQALFIVLISRCDWRIKRMWIMYRGPLQQGQNGNSFKFQQLVDGKTSRHHSHFQCGV